MFSADSDKGQSSVEFLMSFMFAIGFVFLFTKMAMNYSVGYVVHYATYMASRTYLTADKGDNNVSAGFNYAENRAREVFERFPLSELSMTPNYDSVRFNAPNNVALYEYVGAHYSFSNPLSNYRIVGGDINLNFVSESFLGKEPIRIECFKRTCDMAGVSCDGEDLSYAIYDNGC